MPRLYYCDESGNNAVNERIGIATCSGSSEQWDALGEAWARQLQASKVTRDRFHATSASAKLRMALAQIMYDIGIAAACCTLRPSDFVKATKQEDRGRYGGPYGFARYVQLLQISAAADSLLDQTSIAIYIDQGGLGGAWFIQLLEDIASHEELSKNYRLVAFGTVDRRQDLCIHCADLVAHELLTDRHSSPVLKLLGKRVLVDDWGDEAIAETIAEFNKLRAWVDKLKENAKKQPKSEVKG